MNGPVPSGPACGPVAPEEPKVIECEGVVNRTESSTTTRREFLGLSGAALMAPATVSWASAEPASSKQAVYMEAPWRESGQVKDPEYLRTAKLRYAAEGREIIRLDRTQGGVTGYAPVVGGGALNARAGLALDVPFGLVDFVEVMQFGYAGSSLWFDFLNLGYKLAPSAGTDYMTDATLPGAERNYVHVKGPFSLQGWFDAFKQGETFVTNGPMLEFTVNGKGMGSDVRLKSGDKLTINAAASINPDIDSLESLELNREHGL